MGEANKDKNKVAAEDILVGIDSEPTSDKPEIKDNNESVVSPEPTPQQAAVEKEQNIQQNVVEQNNYKKMQEELANLSQLRDIVFGDEELFGKVLAIAKGEKVQPATKMPVSKTPMIPQVPELFDANELGDPESASAKWFAQTINSINENAGLMAKQKAEETIQNLKKELAEERNHQQQQFEINNALRAASQEEGLNDQGTKEFWQWVNEPKTDKKQYFKSAIQIWKISTGKTPVSTNVITKAKNAQESGKIPSITQIGGETNTEPITEEDAFNNFLNKAGKKTRF